MNSIKVKQFGKVVEEFQCPLRDCRNHEVRLNSWAKAMNYIETDGNRTAGSGDVYYDTIEDAVEDGMFSTIEEAVDFYKKHSYLIGELSEGEIIFEE